MAGNVMSLGCHCWEVMRRVIQRGGDVVGIVLYYPSIFLYHKVLLQYCESIFILDSFTRSTQHRTIIVGYVDELCGSPGHAACAVVVCGDWACVMPSQCHGQAATRCKVHQKANCSGGRDWAEASCCWPCKIFVQNDWRKLVLKFWHPGTSLPMAFNEFNSAYWGHLVALIDWMIDWLNKIMLWCSLIVQLLGAILCIFNQDKQLQKKNQFIYWKGKQSHLCAWTGVDGGTLQTTCSKWKPTDTCGFCTRLHILLRISSPPKSSCAESADDYRRVISGRRSNPTGPWSSMLQDFQTKCYIGAIVSTSIQKSTNTYKASLRNSVHSQCFFIIFFKVNWTWSFDFFWLHTFKILI